MRIALDDRWTETRGRFMTITMAYVLSFPLVLAISTCFYIASVTFIQPLHYTSPSISLLLLVIYSSPVKNCALPIPKLQSSFPFVATLTTKSDFGTPHSCSKRSANAAYTSCFCSVSRPCWNIWMRISFSVRGRERPVSSKRNS